MQMLKDGIVAKKTVMNSLGYDSYQIMSDLDEDLNSGCIPVPTTTKPPPIPKIIANDQKLRKAELILKALRYKYEADLRAGKTIIKVFVPCSDDQVNDEACALLIQKFKVVLPEAEVTVGEIDMNNVHICECWVEFKPFLVITCNEDTIAGILAEHPCYPCSRDTIIAH
jgi:hypothetical protein